ncbi:MAG: hypothetical protein JW919_00705 [Candidatus Omnitrophica bacterium]|nr:hypothetical protein [Candidatus Omnitrophota bacterium]
MAKISKIIYMVEAPFCKRDYERFGVDTMKDSGFAVEVWDLTPALHPDIYAKITGESPINCDGYRLFRAKKEVLKAVSAIREKSFVVSFVFYDLNSYPMFRAISRKGIEYAMFAANALPKGNNRSTVPDALRRLRRLTADKISNAIFLRLPFAYFGVRPAALLLAGGKISANQYIYYPLNGDTKIVWAHALDYDIYLKEKEKASVAEKPFALFLDEDICFHRDYLYVKHAPFATPDKYYGPLRKFFSLLEKKSGLDVVIAAHPRSKYEELPDYFGKRPVIKGKTVELVKRSSFVIAHSTTSINYAILFKKPLICVTTNELKAGAQGRVIDDIASQFNKRAVNVDEALDIDLAGELSIDETAYREYIESYIKRSVSEDKPFWQIVSDAIKVHV